MKKAMMNIMKKENRSVLFCHCKCGYVIAGSLITKMGDKEMQSVAARICEISNGDIRSAVNSLQMMLTS